MRPSITRFTTKYITLRSIRDSKKVLKSLVQPKKGKSSKLYGKEDANDAKHTVLIDGYLWRSIYVNSRWPLVKVLQLVNSDLKLVIGLSNVIERMRHDDLSAGLKIDAQIENFPCAQGLSRYVMATEMHKMKQSSK